MGYIELKHVDKNYKNQSVFSDLNLTFEKGHSYGIMGHNGSGKSVLLKLIAGFAFADAGDVVVDGKTMKKDIDFIPNAGVSINAPEFMNNMSGLKNLLYLAEIRKVISKADIEEVLKTFDLYHARNKKVSAYSQGMKQRLRLAQAVMESPDILLLDEPMNALDKEGVRLVKSILKQHIKQGKTLIFTSHSQEDMDDLAEIRYEIDEGEVRELTIVQKNNE